MSTRKWLIALLGFNALTAMAGGLALMSGVVEQTEWLVDTGFASLYFPGLILFALVGGSSAMAALSWLKLATGRELVSLAAAVIMLVWIIGEMLSISAFHWLQVIYLITGLAIIWLTPAELYRQKSK